MSWCRPAGWRKPESAKYMSKREVAALLFAAKAIDRRSFDFLALMYLLGLRIDEACHLRYEHLTAKHIDKSGFPRAIEVPSMKKRALEKRLGHKPLIWVPVLAHWDWVRDAFDPRRRTGKGAISPWLFPSGQRPGKCVTTRAMMNAWNAARNAANLNRLYTSHSLRHTAATELFRVHRDKSVAARFLRHDEKTAGDTTMTYLHMSVADWAPMMKSRCLELPELRPLPRAATVDEILGR